MTDRVPELDGPLIGFREWRLDDGLLRPMTARSVWPRQASRAGCLSKGPTHAQGHAVPASGCGWNAWYSDSGLAGSEGRKQPFVAGAVAAWGEVELHADGFRAEYAERVALALEASLSDGWRAEAEAAARRYGIPLLPWGELRTMTRGVGTPVLLLEQPVEPLHRFLDLAVAYDPRDPERDEEWRDLPDDSSWRIERQAETYLGLAAAEIQRVWTPDMSYLSLAQATMLGVIAAAMQPREDQPTFVRACVQQAVRKAVNDGSVYRPARLGLWTYGEVLERVGSIPEPVGRYSPPPDHEARGMRRILTVPQLLSAADELQEATSYTYRKDLLDLLAILSRSELTGAHYWEWLVEGRVQ